MTTDRPRPRTDQAHNTIRGAVAALRTARAKACGLSQSQHDMLLGAVEALHDLPRYIDHVDPKVPR